jgi:hypothetical protein
MATFYESFGSFNSGIPSHRQLVSKKSKGTITLTETFLSFESHVDKILFQVKLSEIQDISIKTRSSINLIELQTPHQTYYTLYPIMTKTNSNSSSKEMTMELFGQLTRLIFNKDQTILFDTIGGFYLGSLRSYYLKEMTIQGYIFLTENYIFFKSFQPKGIYKINVLDFKDLTMEIVDSTTYIKIETIDEQVYSLFPLKIQRRKLGRDSKKTEKLYDVLNQAKMYKESEQVRLNKDEKGKIKKIETMLKVSDRLKLKTMRIALGLDKESFNNQIFEWAKMFDFTIDGDYININKETTTAFLHHLVSLGILDLNEKRENISECSFCGSRINSEAMTCPYCGNIIEKMKN